MNLKPTPRLALLLSLLLLPLLISNDSLWLDEGDTSAYALQPDLRSWWQFLRQDIAADCQMPLSMFCAWLGGRTVGTAEWQLRSVNILWGILALTGMHRAGKRLQLPWLPFLLAIQPYFWFYMNEARPYALQVACGAWLVAAFAEFIATEGSGELWAWIFVISVFFLCLSTMLAPVTVFGLLLAAIILARLKGWHMARRSTLILLAGALANIPIAVYYVSTLVRGAKGAQIWSVDLKFFGYVVYELTGLTGLGLPVERIRELAREPHLGAALVRNFAWFVLPTVCFGSLLTVLFGGLRKRNKNAQTEFMIGCFYVLLVASVTLISASILLQKAFWARHFAPVFAFYVCLLAAAVSRTLAARRFFWNCLTSLLLALLLFSGLNLRFAARHRKEDYRAAAQIAQRALDDKKSVWWIAGCLPAAYYHLGYTMSEPQPGKVFCPQLEGRYENVPAPDMIISSKPDIFDSSGKVQKLIREGGYRAETTLKSFVIYTRRPPVNTRDAED